MARQYCKRRVPHMPIGMLLLARLMLASSHVWHQESFASAHHPSAFIIVPSTPRRQSWSWRPLLPHFDIGTSLCSSPGSDQAGPAWDLRVGIVGAGPSGLLLAHRLAQSTLPLAKIDVYESRSDPRGLSRDQLGGRAYALGLGARGRTAIRSVDETLLSAVEKKGFECERFRLHFGAKFNVKLREREDGVEPSLLIYQTDLCAALLDELEGRANPETASWGAVEVHFDSNITHIDLASSTISVEGDTVEAVQDQKGPYDLIVGCDGAKSTVRKAIQQYSPPNTFSYTQRKLLPGCFKVARLSQMPPLMDPNSVGLVLPESISLGITAFIEPTVDGGACILFAGRLSTSDEAQTTDGDSKDVNLGSVLFPRLGAKGESRAPPDTETTAALILDQFPLLTGTPRMEELVQQLLSQRTSVADSVKCNTYSSNSDVMATAICGDAAHATGGVSGQGCNSALMDSVALSDCLIQHYQPTNAPVDAVQAAKRAMLHRSVTSYSRKAVPEGHALYDLSFGNDGETLPMLRNIRASLSNAIDAVFAGRWGIGQKPLQSLLASSAESFVEMRRGREKYFVESFKSDTAWHEELGQLYQPSHFD